MKELLNNNQNVQVSDTRGDAMKYASWLHKHLTINWRLLHSSQWRYFP
jgi:hypothetical protein